MTTTNTTDNDDDDDDDDDDRRRLGSSSTIVSTTTRVITHRYRRSGGEHATQTRANAPAPATNSSGCGLAAFKPSMIPKNIPNMPPGSTWRERQ
jgi:hypothetical protein